jgi:hypothetical protein
MQLEGLDSYTSSTRRVAHALRLYHGWTTVPLPLKPFTRRYEKESLILTGASSTEGELSSAIRSSPPRFSTACSIMPHSISTATVSELREKRVRCR